MVPETQPEYLGSARDYHESVRVLLLYDLSDALVVLLAERREDHLFGLLCVCADALQPGDADLQIGEEPLRYLFCL